MTMPSTSPIAQPVRQWTVALRARRLSDWPVSWPAWAWVAIASPAAHEAPDGGHQLIGLLGPVGALGAHHAVAGVLVEQPERDLVQRGVDGADLRDDVDAV